MLPARLAPLLAVLCGLLLPSTALAVQAAPQQTWHGRQLHLYDVQRAGFTGAGVTVAVLDGWVDTSHPDFGRRLVRGADCSSGTCASTMGRDNCGQEHGTHVAGTVTSSSYGVATRATLMPIRVLTADSAGECTGDPAAVAAGIRWAVAHGARVLNLSLGPDVPGTSTTSPISTAVREAAAADVVVVFSAGNRDLPLAQSYGSDALVVAATGPSGRLATYSQHGQGVSVAAPGGEPDGSTCTQATCVTSLYTGGGYAVAAGTSMAAPHVAGLAALLLAAHPSWTAAQVRSRITGTAHPLSGAGAGVVDAAAALGVRLTSPTASPTPTKKAPVRARATTPARTTSPAPAPVRSTPTPQRAPARTSAPSPVTVAAPSPSPLSAVPVAGSPLPSGPDPVPVPLAAVAGLLVGLAGAAVVILPRLR